LAAITNISLDHTEFLGKDIPSIAREKGGIIKEGIPVVLGSMDPLAEEVLGDLAFEKGAEIVRSKDRHRVDFFTLTTAGLPLVRMEDLLREKTTTYTIGLAGNYQQENLETVLSCVDCLRNRGWNLKQSSVERGVEHVLANTGILGRWQVLGANPRSICDTAHNQAGIQAVMDQLQQIPCKKLHLVWGMVSDKNLGDILPLLPSNAAYYFTQAKVARSLDAGTLEASALKAGLRGSKYQDVASAYRAALGAAGPDDMIFTGGSTFVVADLLEDLGY
jgi:dihydrofolate synthase/folylpolyglutamate synthase